ncbi:ABC transporter permease [Caballeronia sp. 15711]|uniref:ABC transporter permease n=1 Tax=Caballeronia sp. 15711 TaxID=3391029 RepID=UPI0039E4D702
MQALIRSYLRHPSGIIGLVILLVIIALAALAPLICPGSPWDSVGQPFMPPDSPGLLLGSDSLGRDIESGIVHGASVSLLIGCVSTLAAVLMGLAIGATAGYLGGRVGDWLMRFTELFQVIPAFLLAILVVAILTPSIRTLTVAIALVSWPQLARITRAEFMALREREFVQAARCQGESGMAIVLRQIMPNALSPIIVTASLSVANAVLMESALSFMGLGDPNLMSWGFMIGEARTMIRVAWWMSAFPGLAILLTVMAINLVGEGLNDVLNPRISRR